MTQPSSMVWYTTVYSCFTGTAWPQTARVYTLRREPLGLAPRAVGSSR